MILSFARTAQGAGLEQRVGVTLIGYRPRYPTGGYRWWTGRPL